MAEKIPYSKQIAERVRILAASGMSKRAVMADIQSKDWQDVPLSASTFNKLYGLDYEVALGEQIEAIGNVAMTEAKKPENAKEREFVLRAKGGWSPKETVETREVEDDDLEQVSAVNKLMEMLGKSPKED
jgi:hypothetical protein